MTPNRDGLLNLLRQYMASRHVSPQRSFAQFLRERNPHVFSHHDCTQADYSDHVWRCGGLHICRGCTAVFVALSMSLIVGLLTRWPARISTAEVAALLTGLLLLALLPLPATPRTLLHDGRRAALGLLLGCSASYLILAEEWLPRAIVIAVYLAVLVARRALRGASRRQPAPRE
jgi:hypothetical protein